jgi:hypothetical protein
VEVVSVRTSRIGRVVVAGLVALAVTVGSAPGGAAASGDAGVHERATGARSVVVWNHLDGPWSVRHSVVGAGFDVVGTPVFRRGKWGRSVGLADDESLLLMSQRNFFGADRRQGTVSMFVKKRMVASVPYVTPFVGVFGQKPYDFQTEWCATNPLKNPNGVSCTNYAIGALWGDGLSGPAGLYFEVHDADDVTVHRAVDPAFNTTAVPAFRWVHLLFVWDLDGIKGSADRMRLYRDGRLVARNTDPIDGVLSLPTPVSLDGTHATSRLTGPALLVDEVAVLHRAVTP